jgi:hypothetical protein
MDRPAPASDARVGARGGSTEQTGAGGGDHAALSHTHGGRDQNGVGSDAETAAALCLRAGRTLVRLESSARDRFGAMTARETIARSPDEGFDEPNSRGGGGASIAATGSPVTA